MRKLQGLNNGVANRKKDTVAKPNTALKRNDGLSAIKSKKRQMVPNVHILENKIFTPHSEDNLAVNKNIIHSSIRSTGKRLTIGIDEAGRGPVLGYLVYEALIIEEENDITNPTVSSALKDVHSDIKMCDSKLLLPKQRGTIYDQIRNTHSYVWYALHPEYISTEMDRRNLNDISISAVVYILRIIFEALSTENGNKRLFWDCQERTNTGIGRSDEIGKNVSLRRDGVENVFIDALGNTDKYLQILQRHFPSVPFTIKPKADSIYRCVGGASIIAKVVRDDLLKQFSAECGSGYPSDWRTVKWLDTNRECEMVRFKWACVKRNDEKRKSAKVYGKYDSLHFCDY